MEGGCEREAWREGVRGRHEGEGVRGRHGGRV